MNIVLDSSVIAKWYFKEENFQKARQILETHRLHLAQITVPVLLFFEIGNIFINKKIAARDKFARNIQDLYDVNLTVIEINEKNILAQEEVFGPVLSVLKAKNFEDALRLGNQTRYALTGGLYSRTPSHITKAKKEFEVGNLYVNRGCTGAVVGRQHFGGFKKSGLGSKAGGPDYLPRFMKRVVRTINQDRSGHIPNILKYVQ